MFCRHALRDPPRCAQVNRHAVSERLASVIWRVMKMNPRCGHKRAKQDPLVRLETYALDNPGGVVCPLASGNGHVLYARGVHSRPASPGFGHFRY